MASLTDALDQFRARDPARNLTALSSSEREANCEQIMAVGPPTAASSSEAERSQRRRPDRGQSPVRTVKGSRLHPWLTLRAGVLAAAVVALVVVLASGMRLGFTRAGAKGANVSLAVPHAAELQLDRVAYVASVREMPAASQWEYLAIKLESTGTATVDSTPVLGGGGLSYGGGVTVAYHDTQIEQNWFATDGDARQRITNESFSFLTPQDRARYLAHKGTFKRTGQIPSFMLAKAVFEDRHFPSHDSSQPNWATWPPADARKLIDEIWAQFLSADNGPTSGLVSRRPAVLWDALTEILLSSTSAQLRATAYRALAYVPYTSVLGERADQRGRTGMAIYFTDGDGETNDTLIVSPTTGDLLELDQATKSKANGVPAGTVISREIFLQRAIVKTSTALPNGHVIPYNPIPKN